MTYGRSSAFVLTALETEVHVRHLSPRQKTIAVGLVLLGLLLSPALTDAWAQDDDPEPAPVVPELIDEEGEEELLPSEDETEPTEEPLIGETGELPATEDPPATEPDVELEEVEFEVIEHKQDPCPVDEPVTLVVHELEPMVMYERGELTGFDIELWDMIAEEMGCDYEPIAVESVPTLIDTVAEGEADVGIAGITITGEREERVDFSLPYYDSGLAIMVISEETSMLKGFWNILTNWDLIKVFLSYATFLCFAGFLVWVCERFFYPKKEREPGEIAYEFWKGFPQSVYFMNVTSTTVGYGHYTARSWPARILTSLMMYVGFIFVGLVVGVIAEIRIDEANTAHMNTAADLAGVHVAVEAGTTSEVAARKAGAKVTAVSRIDQGFDLLKGGGVEAVVFDEPVLIHHARGEGSGEVVVTGEPFTTERYGMLFPPDSPLRESANVALLTMMGDGRFDQLHNEWFGELE